MTVRRINSLSKIGVQLLNEDAILLDNTSGIFGVFDGASSLDAHLLSTKKTGGYIASHAAADIFSQPHNNLTEALESANKHIDSIQKDMEINTSDIARRFSTTAAVVKITQDQAELLQIGDSIIIVIHKDGRAEVPLGYHDHDRGIMRTWRKLADEGKKNIRQLVAKDIVQLRRSANSAYGTLNGDSTMNKFVKTSSINLHDMASILIITDGMFIPKADSGSTDDWNNYVQLYREGGLDKIYSIVRERERSDPELTLYPRYKRHDDASGIAIDFA